MNQQKIQDTYPGGAEGRLSTEDRELYSASCKVPTRSGSVPGSVLDPRITTVQNEVSEMWKTQQWPWDCKRSVFIPIPKKGNAKECSNYHTTAFISHASKVMLKILQARFQQYVNRELLDVQAAFRKSRGTGDQIANICWIIEIAREFQKKQLLLLHWDYAKDFDYMDHNKLENS